MHIDRFFWSSENFRGKILKPLPGGSRIGLIEDRREHFRVSLVGRFAGGFASHSADCLS
ncbi:hypothetical protein SBA6_490015 [Candidatus Sulfopaludibacter sp. SbA6]|nr:hypothetical protein SBA6_490015 [Candidatus Sulfopaludibacter sp. SbA6]